MKHLKFKLFTALLGLIALSCIALQPSCSSTQQSQAQATVADAFDAGAVIVQAFVSLKQPVPASALQTGNSKVDQYIATATSVLSAPPTQALVNDLFKLAASNPKTVPATNP